MADTYFIDTDTAPTFLEGDDGDTLLVTGENTAEAARQSGLAAGFASDASLSAAAVGAATNALFEEQSEVLGRGGALAAGTALTTQQCYYLNYVVHDGSLTSVDIWDRGAGNAEVAVYRNILGTWTLQSSQTITLTGAGAQVNKVLAPALAVEAGDMLAFRAVTAGVAGYTAGTEGLGIYTGGVGAFPGTVVPGANAGIYLQLRFNLTWQEQTVTAATFADVKATAEAAETAATSAQGVIDALFEEQSEVLGRGGALAAGTALTTQQCYYLNYVVHDGSLTSVDIWDRGAGNAEVAVYRNILGTWTLQSSQTITLTGAGAQVNKVLAPALAVEAGDMLAFRAVTAGVAGYTAGTEGLGIHVAASGAFPGTVVPGANTAIYLQLRFNMVWQEQTVTAAALETLEQRSLDFAEPVALAAGDYPARFVDGSGWQHLLVYGQSLATGVAAQPALSTAQPYANKSFGSGPRAGRAGNGWGAVNTAPGTSTAIALVEENASGGAPAADGATNSGETICTAAASKACELALTDDALAPGNFIWFASAPGHTGYTIAQLNKAAGWYANLTSHVTDAKALATAAGKGYKVPCLIWVQGESDAIGGTTYAAYKAALAQLAIDVDTDIRAITGQTEPVHTLIYQTAGGNGTATLARVADVRRAQFDAVKDAARLLHFVTPIYHLQGAGDQLHLTNVSERRLARAMGRAIKQLTIDRCKPDCIWPVAAWARGTELRVKFNVPAAPLLLDSDSLGTIADHGWKVSDGTGTLVLSSIAVSSSGDEVVMTLNRVLGSNPVVRHALDFVSSKASFTFCAGGALRDSTPGSELISGTSYPLWHVAPAFELPVTVLETLA